jgi:hypothetical protein
MAISQSDVDNLEAALMTGTLSVEVDGRKVTYRGVGELKAALGYARDQIAAASGGVNRQSFASFSKD